MCQNSALGRRLPGGAIRGILGAVVLIVVLCVSFVSIKRLSSKRNNGHSHTSYKSYGAEKDDIRLTPARSNAVEERLRDIPDVRAKRCVDANYNIKESVSVIIDFNEYQFYNAKTTITSILQAQTSRVAEIIVIDDGSTLQYIIDESNMYLTSLPNVRLIRFTNQMGQLNSRLRAVAEAKSDIVVFLDVNVICTRGWLEPLIDLVTKEPNTIAVPHYDLIHDPVALTYRRTPSLLVATWTWNLSLRMTRRLDLNETPIGSYVNSPAVRVNAFAARKSLLSTIAVLDKTFGDNGGEYLDLSLKAWLCGGAIKVVLCSHVGVLNLFTPVTTRGRKNVRYLVSTWFGHLENTILRLTGITPKQSVAKFVSHGHNCKDLSWYLKEVKNDTRTPSADAAHYGMLRVNTGRCMRIGRDLKPDLPQCDADHANEEHFELTVHGLLRTASNQCLATTSSAYISVEPCRADDTRHQWVFTPRNELGNVWSNFCCVHVTDPDTNYTGRQIAMAQKCDLGKSENNQFKHWSFISN